MGKKSRQGIKISHFFFYLGGEYHNRPRRVNRLANYIQAHGREDYMTVFISDWLLADRLTCSGVLTFSHLLQHAQIIINNFL